MGDGRNSVVHSPISFSKHHNLENFQIYDFLLILNNLIFNVKF